MPRLRPTLIAAAIAALALPAGAARAATVTIGSDLTNTGGEVNLCGPGFKYVYYQTLAGTPVAVAPFDGTITAWRLKAGSATGAVRLRVLQPGPGGTVTA